MTKPWFSSEDLEAGACKPPRKDIGSTAPLANLLMAMASCVANVAGSTSTVLPAVQLHDLARQPTHVPRGHPADRFDQNRDLAFGVGRLGGHGHEDEQVIGRIELELAVGECGFVNARGPRPSEETLQAVPRAAADAVRLSCAAKPVPG